MEGAMAKNLCQSSAPRAELDYRARDARLRLVRIQQVLAPRARGKGFRLVRLFGFLGMRPASAQCRLVPRPAITPALGSTSRRRPTQTAPARRERSRPTD